jgi:hypothetical protein
MQSRIGKLKVYFIVLFIYSAKACLPVFLVSHKSPILEMDLGRLALASEFTGGHTLPKKEHGLPILKWYGMSSCNLSFRHSY